EGEVVLDAGLGVDLVPVLGDRGVVDLHGEAGCGDGLVLGAHHLDPGVEEGVDVAVVVVDDAAAGAGREGGEEAALVACGVEGRLRVGDVLGDQGAPDLRIGHRPGRGGEGGLAAHGEPGGGVRVGLREEGPAAAVREGGQAHVAGGGAHRLGREVVGTGELEAADAVEDVRPPGAVVHGRAHQVPVLAVVRQRDADLALLGDDV